MFDTVCWDEKKWSRAMAEEAKRKPGRPTDKRKDTILRLRIDTDTHKQLAAYAKQKGVSMSEIVREAVENIIQTKEVES